MNIQEYVARDLIAAALVDERSRIIAELTDATDPEFGLLTLWEAIDIVRGDT